MKITKIALMGLTLALMAPSVQANEALDQKTMDQKIAKLKAGYPLTWRQTATAVVTGIASGSLYAALLSKGDVFGAFIAMLAMRPLKNVLLAGEMPEDKPGYKMNHDEVCRYWTTWEKKNNIDDLATLVTMFGGLAASAATGDLVIPEVTMPVLTSGLKQVGKIAGVILLICAQM